MEPRQSGFVPVVGNVVRAVRNHPWRTVVAVISLVLSVELLTMPLGEIERLKTEAPSETAFMRQHADAARRENKPFKKQQRWVSLRQVSPATVNAVIVAEDGTFWSHHGFDWFEFKESLLRNLKEARFARGASTITQQLVKNLYLSASKDPIRKLKEWLLTWNMEMTLSKSRILELYLNLIEWGPGV